MRKNQDYLRVMFCFLLDGVESKYFDEFTKELQNHKSETVNDWGFKGW